ncbi:GAF domain-containing protein [Arthrobacter sedimenti]|uniref:GAF domain-containing protein n=1 Tax=Arthrobacter sedimenti TaxID=2694931 RepID=UPI0014234217|nr:GAF domain-containing protein [Arthrobacter sedimenti]
MLDEYVQQWSAIQTVRAAGLHLEDVFTTYFGLSGDADELEVQGYLSGLVMLPAPQRDLLAQAINELLDSIGSMVDGAHYSDQDAASSSGYGDYLRPLALSPDHYDFSAPPVGDNSTSATTSPGSVLDTTDAADAVDAADASGGGLDDAGLDEHEFRRLHALHESGLLETGPEERFDRITRQARDHFGVSSASIALITEDAQIIKSVVGPIGEDLPRAVALCAKTIERDRTLVIPDASIDPEWRDHPLVAGGPGVRFYAGHPLCTADGWRIGTLCLIDDQPRTFTEEDVQVLRRLAAQVQMHIWV